MAPLDLAFLWHMHQPPYRDAESGAYVLPWVRLHATRAYLDLAVIHERFPGVRSTVNFVPGLLEQIEDYAAGTAVDRFLELTARPAADLAEGERIFLLHNFFSVSWEQGVRPLPRYAALLDKRGSDFPAGDPAAVARSFTVGELRDLQVLFNLAWMGFAAREGDETVRALLAKGRDFTEEEKGALLQAQRAIVASILPAWRRLQEAGQVELSASAYWHPILPLLCDTDEARVALPHAPLPPRLRARDDAAVQVLRGLEKFERVFGVRPAGMWPAEGSVSPEALEVFREASVRWVATDEEVLLRSLPGRDRSEILFRPWRVRAGGDEIAVVFRDRGLSDRIGFTYARAPAQQAVDDFFGHLQAIAGHAPQDGERPFCAVILDGENPWEHYPASGKHFLTELFGRLERREQGVRTTTVGARIAEGLPPGRIERIWSGSWIEANFRIWIGHEEDVAAWTLVGEAHRALAAARAEGLQQERLEQARGHLLAAEASDWFWWYGDDFVTANAAEFDELFRARIRAVFQALGRRPPQAAFHPIAAGVRPTAAAMPLREPAGFVHPTLDGTSESWREWLGAGLFRAEQTRGGSMHRGVGVFGSLHFGFDAQNLYLRVDPARRDVSLPEAIDGLRIELRAGDRLLELAAPIREGDISLHELHDPRGRGMGGGRLRAIVELAIPFEAAGLRTGWRVGVSVVGVRGDVEVDRIPAQGWVFFEVPDEQYERILWKV